jgi:hypothetical protein
MFGALMLIKMKAGETDFVGNDKAVVYFDNNNLTTDITYIEAVEILKKCRG